MNGITEPFEDEGGRWFQDLADAPDHRRCHQCQDVAELMDDDDQYWCGPCAGDHDRERQSSEAEDDALQSLRG